MKKKLLALATLIICTTVILCSCVGSAGTYDFGRFAGDYSGTQSFKTVSALSDVSGTHVSSSNELMYFVDNYNSNQKHTIYSAIRHQVIWSATETENTSYTNTFYSLDSSDSESKTAFVIKTSKTSASNETVDTYTLYDANGNQISSVTDKNANVGKTGDLLRFDEKVYSYDEDGDLTAVFNRRNFYSMPSADKYGNYYVETENTGFTIYNEKLEKTCTYELPTAALKYIIAPLSNGNVFVQYTYVESSAATDYTFIESGTKYSLYTYVFSPNGNKSKIDVDFLVSYVTVVTPDMAKISGIINNVKNLAQVEFIREKRIDKKSTSIVMSNNGNNEGSIAPVPGCRSFIAIAEDRWIVSDNAGVFYLVNDKGETISELGKSAVNYNVNFIVSNKKVYNMDLEVVYDMNEHDIENYEMLEHSIVMQNENYVILLTASEVDGEICAETTTLFSNTSAKTIIDSNSKFFIVCDNSTLSSPKYTIYNDLGDSIYTISSSTIKSFAISTTNDVTNTAYVYYTNKDGSQTHLRLSVIYFGYID